MLRKCLEWDAPAALRSDQPLLEEIDCIHHLLVREMSVRLLVGKVIVCTVFEGEARLRTSTPRIPRHARSVPPPGKTSGEVCGIMNPDFQE
eukprot:3157297-Rhodomonas_salina.1